MLPEQVWDSGPIAGQSFRIGRPTGSAMPLAWAHAEFIKLMVSRQRGEIVDCPRIVFERYHDAPRTSHVSVWSECAPLTQFKVGTDLRINFAAVGTLSWRRMQETHWHEAALRTTLPGICTVVLPTRMLAAGDAVEFCWRMMNSTKSCATSSVVAM